MDVPVDDMIDINPIQILCGAIKQRGDPDRSDLYTPGLANFKKSLTRLKELAPFPCSLCLFKQN